MIFSWQFKITLLYLLPPMDNNMGISNAKALMRNLGSPGKAEHNPNLTGVIPLKKQNGRLRGCEFIS